MALYVDLPLKRDDRIEIEFQTSSKLLVAGIVRSQTDHFSSHRSDPNEGVGFYWTELATDENTLFAFVPTSRIVPTTITKITASITAYSAISWASSSNHTFQRNLAMFHLQWGTGKSYDVAAGWGQLRESDRTPES